MRIPFALVALAATSISALAADPFYLGAWKITSAVVAPWWSEPQKPSPNETKALVGKTVVIKTGAIEGPGILGCKGPKYRLKNFTADMLFQGSFGEMHDKDKSADPAAIAAKLGFHGSSWKTLETGCANELDYHFLDPTTAAFGLDNYVFTLKKE